KLEASDEPKQKGKKAPKGTTTAKRGVLEVTRAVSTTPYSGDLTFNAASGKKGRTSLTVQRFMQLVINMVLL
ncbi:MAG: hypothetical protein ACYTX0_56975, partial [Nostoc sp.]